jgi:nicotinate-nucleotide pyrophosphorylase (carboxylating)
MLPLPWRERVGVRGKQQKENFPVPNNTTLPSLEHRIRLALEEDIRDGDRTTEWTIGEKPEGRARIVCKQDGVISGLEVARLVFQCVDPELAVTLNANDGDPVKQGDEVVHLEGRVASILRGERTALNFLCHLSGVATLTRRYVDAVREVRGGEEVHVLDTRKTTPLWRDLEKQAVAHGGGTNHRMGLYDEVLIKDNHIDACGGIVNAIRRVKENNKAGIPIGVECRTLDDVRAAAGEGVDYILADNMSLDEMREAVRIADTIPVEASGGVNLETVKPIAETGVRRISIGALTHSAPVLDFSLLL